MRNTAYPLKAVTFSSFHAHTTAILDIQDMESLFTRLLKLGKTTDKSYSDEEMFYSRMASQVGPLRLSATVLASDSQMLGFSVPPEIIRSLITDQL